MFIEEKSFLIVVYRTKELLIFILPEIPLFINYFKINLRLFLLCENQTVCYEKNKNTVIIHNGC